MKPTEFWEFLNGKKNSLFHFFNFFIFFNSCSVRMGENTTGGRGYKAERVPRRSSAKACRGKIVSPPAGHPSPSGPPLHPHGTRQNNKNESTKKLKRMNHFLKNNMQTCEFVLQNFFSISFTTGSITSCLL